MGGFFLSFLGIFSKIPNVVAYIKSKQEYLLINEFLTFLSTKSILKMLMGTQIQPITVKAKTMQTVHDYSYSQEHKPRVGNPNWGISLPYDVVRDMIKPYKFKSLRQYRDWVRNLKESGAGEGLPLYPAPTYSKRNEWVSKEHFLGWTDNITVSNKSATQKQEQTHISFANIRTIIKQILGLKPVK